MVWLVIWLCKWAPRRRGEGRRPRGLRPDERMRMLDPARWLEPGHRPTPGTPRPWPARPARPGVARRGPATRWRGQSTARCNTQHPLLFPEHYNENVSPPPPSLINTTPFHLVTEPGAAEGVPFACASILVPSYLNYACPATFVPLGILKRGLCAFIVQLTAAPPYL